MVALTIYATISVSAGAPIQQNTLYNQDRAAESVGFHYGLHWPVGRFCQPAAFAGCRCMGHCVRLAQ